MCAGMTGISVGIPLGGGSVFREAASGISVVDARRDTDIAVHCGNELQTRSDDHRVNSLLVRNDVCHCRRLYPEKRELAGLVRVSWDPACVVT